MKNEYAVRPIGVIRSSFKDGAANMPIQPCFSKERGEVEVFREYAEGLKDIEGFSHIILVYLFHKTRGFSLLAKPYLDDEPRGIFSSRYPARPNRIGISIVRLVERKGNVLVVEGIDIIDGAPLLDIKPHIPPYAKAGEIRLGWLEGKI
jgi:tRNA-Thr(GGU) m(6)t(6)A37 methyltransferase TsaA